MAQKKQWMRRGAAFALALTTAASMHAGALATIPVQEDGTVVAQTEPEVQEKQTQTATIDSASMETAESESAELAESEQIEAVAEEVPAVQLVEVNEPESGLRFDSVKNEYVQVQGTVQIPNTVEVWAKIDTEEDRRQIIMNNYGRGGNTWADGIIKANPDKNVIVTTHAFMYWDGTHLNDEDLDYTSAYTEDGLDGSDIWEQLGAQNENVVLAIGGHIGFPDVIARADENGAGKQVTSLLCDAQGIDGTYGLGMLMMLTFHEDSNAVDINWYSAEEGKLFRTRNQFTIDVPHVGESESVSITSVAAQEAITAKTGTEQDELNLPDTVEVTLSDGTVTKLPVTWQCASYDADEEGTYVFVGTLQNTTDVENPLGLTAEITVTLERPTSGGASHPEAGYTSSDRDDEEEDSSEETTEDIDEEDVPLDEGSNTEFADVDSNAWYADAVAYVCEKGLMNGTSETAFSPNQTTTRGMIVTMLYRLENEPAITGTTAFADVAADQYYTNAVAWAAQNGIVSGVDGTTFAPNNAITREQMAAILYRYAQFKGYDVSAKADLSTYADAASVGTYAADAMAWANGAELITGTSATALSPAGQATRAQVAAILMRFCDNIAK